MKTYTKNEPSIFKTNRLTKSNESWTIGIDDGYTCYKFHLDASMHYSIHSLARRISKKIIHKGTLQEKIMIKLFDFKHYIRYCIEYTQNILNQINK